MAGLIKKLRRWRDQRGDTIVEVLLSISILTLVLGAAYALSNRSLSTGVDAQNRSQALSLAQGQIEHLINAQKASESALAVYQKNNAFCIKDDGTVQDATAPTGSPQYCPNYQGQYSLGVKYNSSNGVFTVTGAWDGRSAQSNTVSLFYRVPSQYFTIGDQCKNISGVQTTVPTGYVKDANGNCIQPGDVCPNISGIQTSVPEGYVKNEAGNCVKPGDDDGGGDSGGEELATTSGPPNCVIYGWVPSPYPDQPPGLNGDCSGGHYGSNDYPGGYNNAIVQCNGCYCTATLSDWNYQGTDSEVLQFTKCDPGSTAPNYPAPGGVGSYLPPLNPCYPQIGDAGNCHDAQFCYQVGGSGVWPNCVDQNGNPINTSGTGGSTGGGGNSGGGDNDGDGSGDSGSGSGSTYPPPADSGQTYCDYGGCTPIYEVPGCPTCLEMY